MLTRTKNFNKTPLVNIGRNQQMSISDIAHIVNNINELLSEKTIMQMSVRKNSELIVELNEPIEFYSIIEHIPTLTQARDRRFLALLVYTGMRREEVLGLRWSDIEANSVTPKLHVRQTITFKGNTPIVGDTKTSSGVRDIPIHPDLLQWLTVEPENQEYVVQDSITQQIVKRMWARIAKEINVYGATPHCFRHSFTTMCRRSGMDEKVMQKIGGWSDIATMRNVYTHVQTKDIDTAAQIMNGMFRTPEKPAV